MLWLKKHEDFWIEKLKMLQYPYGLIAELNFLNQHSKTLTSAFLVHVH